MEDTQDFLEDEPKNIKYIVRSRAGFIEWLRGQKGFLNDFLEFRVLLKALLALSDQPAQVLLHFLDSLRQRLDLSILGEPNLASGIKWSDSIEKILGRLFFAGRLR